VRSAPKLASTLRENFAAAALFKDLATLRVDRSLLPGVGALRWQGPTSGFDDVCARLDAAGLAKRAHTLAEKRAT
jgi:hypothetical protein